MHRAKPCKMCVVLCAARPKAARVGIEKFQTRALCALCLAAHTGMLKHHRARELARQIRCIRAA